MRFLVRLKCKNFKEFDSEPHGFYTSIVIRFRNRDIKHNLKQNSKLLYLVSSRHVHYSREMTRMIITHLSDLQTSTRNDISVILVAYLTRQGSIYVRHP